MNNKKRVNERHIQARKNSHAIFVEKKEKNHDYRATNANSRGYPVECITSKCLCTLPCIAIAIAIAIVAEKSQRVQ